MKISLFKLSKNKRFNYNPRYYKDNSNEAIYQFDSVYTKKRNSIGSADISSKWKEERVLQRNRANRSFSKSIFLIVLVLILIFLFIIDFDLSIFI
ncbi:uncharacterized protein METZ01_LOCUS169447 [marine metagenome]|uniref:Riboflavin synthase subunit beta n=1 Tax=marine metagenome TaxID=408172 RepID=A0A382BU49_9ZZZZ